MEGEEEKVQTPDGNVNPPDVAGDAVLTEPDGDETEEDDEKYSQ